MDVPGRHEAFAVFDKQGSGCISYGVDVKGAKCFVKTTASEESARSLARANQFHTAVRHNSIVAPLEAIRAERRIATLIYPWIDGVVLNQNTTTSSDKSGLDRFQSLPLDDVESGLAIILNAHLAVVEAGFVAVDLYDGCFLYDFDTKSMHLIDLDEYRPGPFTLTEDRLPGSTRYMAPEEFLRGSMIDERTTVFNLGRTIAILLDSPQVWRGTRKQRRVAGRATAPDPDRRFESVRDLADAWTLASKR